MNRDDMKVNGKWNLDNSYASLPELFYSRQNPIPVPKPQLIILNKDLAESLGFDTAGLESKDGVDILAGNRLP